MRKRYHFARQRAQLIHFSKQLTALREAGRTISDEQLSRFRGMVKALAPRLGSNNLRRALGTGALLLGVAFGVQAQGVPNFTEPQPAPFGMQADEENDPYARPVLADLDGDGDLDLMYGIYADIGSAMQFAYQENIGTATEPAFGPRQVNPFGLTPATDLITVQLVDLDGDGDLDLFEAGFNYEIVEVGNEGDPIILYRENTGSATEPAFAAPQVNPWGLTTPDVEINSIVADFGDLDGDGDLDILAFSDIGELDLNSTRIYFYENTTPDGGEISFAAPVVGPFGITDVSIAYRIPDVLADIDGDGDLDLFGSAIEETDDENGYAFPSLFIENIGSVTEAAFDTVKVGDNFGIDEYVNDDAVVRSELADLDGDGDLDLLVTSDIEGFVFYRNGFPTGVREQRVNIEMTAMPNPTSGLVNLVTSQTISRIEIYDALGRRLQSLVGTARTIDLSALPAGTYTAKLVLPAGTFALRRIVKR